MAYDKKNYAPGAWVEFTDEVCHTTAVSMHNLYGTDGKHGLELLSRLAVRISEMTNLLMCGVAETETAKHRCAKLTLRASRATQARLVDVSGLDPMYAIMKQTRQFRTVLRNFHVVFNHDDVKPEELVAEFKRDVLFPIGKQLQNELEESGDWKRPTIYLDDHPKGQGS